MSKSDANKQTLSDRMKKYEAVTIGMNLVPNMPIYIRIDMRAGHSFCKGLGKPFDDDYSNAIAKVMKLHSYGVKATKFHLRQDCSNCNQYLQACLHQLSSMLVLAQN